MNNLSQVRLIKWADNGAILAVAHTAAEVEEWLAKRPEHRSHFDVVKRDLSLNPMVEVNHERSRRA